MRFAIIGAGPMGCLVGAILVKGGAEVWLVNRPGENIQAIKKNGLRLRLKGKDEIVALNAVEAPEEIAGEIDVIIFLVKGTYTDAAAKSAQCLADKNTYVMTLQNGIGNADILAKYYDNDKILYGFLEFAGKMIELGHVEGYIGEKSEVCFGSTTRTINEDMKKIEKHFKDGGINVTTGENVDGDIWFKLRNNSVNVVMGLLRLSIGQAMTAEGTDELLRKVRNEVIEVAKAKGIKIPEEKLNGPKNGKTTFNPELFAHIPSTAQDMKNKKPTEVEFINGYIYKEGLKVGVSTPYNEMLYRMVKIMEDTYDKQF